MASLFFTPASYSDTILYESSSYNQVFIGGRAYIEAGSRVQNNTYSVTPNNDNIGFDSASSVHLTVKNKAIQDTTIGLQLGFATHTISTSQAGSNYWDRTYIWVDNDKYGYLEYGTNAGAAHAMETNGTSIAVATGGANGSWNKYFNTNTLTASGATAVNGSNFIIFPGLLFPDDDFQLLGTNERARKITYYCPKFYGFQFGVTYIADTVNYGSISPMPNSSGPNRNPSNGVTGGITWEKNISDQEHIKLALIGEYGRLDRSGLDKANGREYYNPRIFELGANYRYQKLTIGGSYSNQWKSDNQKIAGIQDAYFITAGAKYDLTTRTRWSVSYLYSENLRNIMNVVSLGGEHNLFDGCLPYIEATYINMKQSYNYVDVPYNANGQASLLQSNYSNSGIALIIGTSLSF